ncbi:MAG TPA: hypothetical protein GXZ58_00805 [Bacilli bacterium]|nr:hypothetical protein [Bacilli bacterium]
MIEINFFEREKKNYSPLILVAIFLVGLLVVSAYVMLMNTSLENQLRDNLTKISEQQPRVNELKQIQVFSDQVRELSHQLELLDGSQYPTPLVYETVYELLPQSDALYLHDYTFSIEEGLKLSVQLVHLDQVIDLQRSLLDLAFVTDVVLETVDLVSQDEQHYLVNIQVEIDRDLLSEVTQDD